MLGGGQLSTPQNQQNLTGSQSHQPTHGRQYPSSLPSLVLDSSVSGPVLNAQHNVTNRTSWGGNSAIQRIQPGADSHFHSLDTLLQDMVGVPFPTPIADFLDANFKLNKDQQDLLLDLNYNSLESFVVYGALSVCDHIATVGRSYINNKDLALCIFVARVMAGLIHDQAQRSQHNVLAVGNIDLTVDLSNLPSYPPAVENFLSKIDAGHVKRAVGRFKRRDVAGEIKHEIQKRLSDPHLGSVIEVRSQSGYIRSLQRPDNNSVVSAFDNGSRQDQASQRGDNSVVFVGQRISPSVNRDQRGTSRATRSVRSSNSRSTRNPLRLSSAQTAALEFAKTSNRRLPPPEKDVTRTTLPARYTWDGRMDSFPEFQSKVEGFYSQAGAGYLFLEDFQGRYLLNGSACWIYFQDEVPSESQVKKDIKALYGALQTACKVGVGRTIMTKYKSTRDGVRAWIAMVKKYENGGDRETRINTLEAIIETPFHDRYKGGLLQWISDYENAFAEMEELECQNWNDDAARKRRILNNVSSDEGMEKFMFKEQCKDMTAEQVFEHLRKFCIQSDKAAENKAFRRAKFGMTSSPSPILDTSEIDYDRLAQKIAKVMSTSAEIKPAPVIQELSPTEALCCKLSQIPNEVWRQLPRDVQQVIIAKRREELSQDKKPEAKEDKTKKPAPMPRQYSGNLVEVEEDEDEDASLNSTERGLINAFLASAEEDDEHAVHSASIARTSFCGQGITRTVEVGISASSRRNCLNSLTIPSNYSTSIMDSGADTCILGQGWHVVNEHPTRRVKVVGFDKEYATKSNLPIVSAMTVFEPPSGDPILVQVNEAVLNKTADHSLLSTYQIGEHKVDVDARPIKHGGKQSMVADDVTIDFKIRHCMVYFGHRMPTQEEMDTLTPIVLTQGEVPWNPQDAAHSTDEAEEFDREVAEHICQMGFAEDFSLADVTEDCIIDADTAWEYATSKACPVTTEFGKDHLDVKSAVPHLHRALPAKVDYDKLAKYFLYRPKEVIQKTLQNTTQLAKATINFPLKRHIRSCFQQLRRPRLNEIVATDTQFASVKSIEGYTCSQMFYGCTSNLMEVYGMRQEAAFPDAYQDFMREWGIPHTLRRDNSKTQGSDKIKKLHRDLIIADQFSEPHCQWQNPAEIKGIKNLKAQAQVVMDRVGAPEHLWFLCQKYLCEIHNHSAHPQNDWKSPYQVSRGDTPDISHLLQFYWYEPVLYKATDPKYPNPKELPGHFVGIAKNTGDALTFQILCEDGKTIIDRSVVRSALDSKHRNRRVKFDDEVEDQLDSLEVLNPFAIPKDLAQKDEVQVENDDDSLILEEDDNIANRTRSRTRIAFHASAINPRKSKSLNITSIFKLMPYLVLFFLHNCIPAEGSTANIPDLGEVEEQTYSTAFEDISPDFMAQLRYIHALDEMEDDGDPDPSTYLGYDKQLWSVKNVINHRWKNKNGKRIVQLKAQFSDPNMSSQWVDMFALAMQDPIPIIKYAHSKHLVSQGPFKKLVMYCAGDSPSSMARAFKAKIRPGGPKIKFGIQVPLGVKMAFALDKRNGNTLWREAIKIELAQLDEFKVFRALKKGEPIPAGYKQIPYHIVFDVKFDLRHKARLVADGNWTEATREDIYSGVVAMDTVRIGFFVGELNHLKCCAGDVGNAFLNGWTKEKVFIVAGPEFGPELEGRILIVVRSLYGLRTSAARYHEHLSDTLRSLGFSPTKADANFWIRDKGDHYEYLASYVDDILIWSQDPMAIMEDLKKVYTMKGVGIPEYYLGGDVTQLDEHWNKEDISLAFSAQTYIKNVIPKFETLFNHTLKPVRTPMAEEFHPEVDDSPLCSSEDAAKFRSIIGCANWLITLGRFDIHYATMSLGRFNMAPRENHLKAAKRILSYVKTFHKGKILFDTSYADTSKYVSEKHEGWSEFYPDCEEEIPHDMPTPKGKPVRLTVYVDADHAHDLVTRRSVTGIVAMVNNTPIRWISKRQKTVESSTYGSELVAARIATELILELRYMLRMIGVPIDGPAKLLGDNMSVVINTTVPSSVLKKKHCAIGYHRVRESIAAGVMTFAHIPSTDNIADIMTKPLPNQQFHKLVKPILFRAPVHVQPKLENALEG